VQNPGALAEDRREHGQLKSGREGTLASTAARTGLCLAENSLRVTAISLAASGIEDWPVDRTR
jgi:hypothetical protein